MKAYLEITNICNRKCSFCPGTEREKCFVPPSVIASRLNRLHHVEELYLHLMGEPLLHPEFAEIAELCRQRGIPVTLTTNGTLLSEEKQKILLENPVFRQINFSLQALEKQETELFDRILLFCRKALKQRPELYLNLRLWNLHPDFSLIPADEPFLAKIFQTLGLPRPETLEFSRKHRSILLKGRLYLHGSSVFEWPVHGSGDGSVRAFCHGLSSQFGILADGSVVPCCLDSEGRVVLGNIDRQSMEEILDSARARRIREAFHRGEAVEELCRHCTFRITHATKS